VEATGFGMAIQLFDKKIVIAVRPDLPSWQAMNTVAHCAAYLGNKLDQPFDTGDAFLTKEGARHPRNAQYAIVVVSAGAGDLKALMPHVRQSGLLYLGFIREMIETTDDTGIERMLAAKTDAEIEYLGVGLFGPKADVDALMKTFRLWK
jgi:hypothetical protein